MHERMCAYLGCYLDDDVMLLELLSIFLEVIQNSLIFVSSLVSWI